MKRGDRRFNKKDIILVSILFVFTVLFLSMCIIRDSRIKKQQALEAQAYNKQEAEKRIQTEKHLKDLKVYDGLILSTYGDSVTGQAKWQPKVVSELGFSKYNNLGIGGTRVSGNLQNSMWQDSRIDTIPADSNVIIFMGGTNDWLQNAELGDINSKDTNKFYGALNVVTDKLTSKFPNAKIIFMSTTFAENTTIFKDKTGIVNNLGFKNTDYGLAVKNVAEAREIAFIDLTSLWNETNITDYVNDESEIGIIHPNDNGGLKMAETIVNTLRKNAGVE